MPRRFKPRAYVRGTATSWTRPSTRTASCRSMPRSSIWRRARHGCDATRVVAGPSPGSTPRHCPDSRFEERCGSFVSAAGSAGARPRRGMGAVSVVEAQAEEVSAARKLGRSGGNKRPGQVACRASSRPWSSPWNGRRSARDARYSSLSAWPATPASATHETSRKVLELVRSATRPCPLVGSPRTMISTAEGLRESDQ